MSMKVFGLTGGLASGKSTVAARFREQGLPVIDADQLAREVVDKGTSGLTAIVEAFGPEVLLPDGALDRKKVADIVFGDVEKRKTLNAIVHPRIAMRSAELVRGYEERGETLVCYEAALLVENRVSDAFRPLVVVAVSPEVQVERAMARDKATEAEARARIAAQFPLAEKVKAADYVIDNSGSREETLRQADEVLAKIRAGVG